MSSFISERIGAMTDRCVVRFSHEAISFQANFVEAKLCGQFHRVSTRQMKQSATNALISAISTPTAVSSKASEVIA